tara:strand:+ start:80340 stop:80810 length:471 start_codon:yes stop_codon:yes gene_type:complete
MGLTRKDMNKNGSEFFKDGGMLWQGDVLRNMSSYAKGEFTICAIDIDGSGEYPVYGGMWFIVDNCNRNGSIITHFTWRNSTGTAPTYTDLVEVKQRNGLVYVDYVKNIDFTLELSDDDVVQWKPYIECELDWTLGGYPQIVEIKVHITPEQPWPRP